MSYQATVKLTGDERRAWQARARAEGCSLSHLIRTSVNQRIHGEAEPTISSLKADPDWLIALVGLGRKMDSWYPQKDGGHDWRDALGWLTGQLAPKLSAGELHLTSTGTRRAVEVLEDVTRRLGFALDNLGPASAPHDGLQELLQLAEGLIDQRLAIVNSKELDELRRANSY